MKIILTEEEMKDLRESAEEYAVDPDDLLEMYTEIQTGNFTADIWDIVNENLEELGGRNFQQEEYERQCEYEERR
jgi:hypothetical protein